MVDAWILLFLTQASPDSREKEMRKFMNTVMLIAIVAVTVALAWWAYQGITMDDPVSRQETVTDADIVCMQVADTGQCMCRHRDTNDLLDVGYDECVSRVMRAQR